MAEPLPRFVDRRRPDWTALEQALAKLRAGQMSLDELAGLDRLYRRASADLARAQAFYPGTDVHRFLNQLCGKAYGAVYRKRADRWAGLKRFYAREFPQVARESLEYTGLAAAIMLLGVVLGATTVAFDPEGGALLLDAGVRDFVARRELWTDSALNLMTPAEMATQIFTNNLQVAFSAFALGITFGVGTVAVIFFNGLQVGALATLCALNGLGKGIFTFMAAHGPVELSIICISGGAGLLLAKALLAPGERPRGEVLRENGGKAIRLVLGCAPFLVGIGLIEGFVSPGPLFPWPFKVALGALLGTAFWTYLLRAGRARA